MSLRARPDPRTGSGFSLIELLVVVGIVALLAAAALPGIGNYFRNYRIREAQSAVAGEITTARNKAIMKNVNWGVLFLVVSRTTYRYVIEDDVTIPREPRRLSMDEMLASPEQVGPLRRLPQDVEFGTTCPTFVASPRAGFRYNRLGAWCDPGSTGCDPIDEPPSSNLIMNTTAGGTRICLVQELTGLTREVRISPGGRVLSENRQR